MVLISLSFKLDFAYALHAKEAIGSQKNLKDFLVLVFFDFQ